MAKKADVAKEVKAKLLEDKKAKEKKEEKLEEPKPEEPKKAEKPAEPKKAEPKKEQAKPAAAKKEEPKKAEKPKEKKPEEVLEEKIITIPLRDAWKSPRKKRASAAVKVLREQLKRHMKKDTKLDISVNRALWAKGIKNPPRKMKLKVKIMKDFARAYFIE